MASAAPRPQRRPPRGSPPLATWKVVLLALMGVVTVSVASHHALAIMLVPRMRHGELLAVGYYGQRTFTQCFGITDGTNLRPVVVLHHAVRHSCQHYVALQERLWHDHAQPSCCLERRGVGYSPLPDIAPKVDLAEETKELFHALNQVIDERTFVHVGHGVGGLYAWQAVALGRHTSRGLVLLDGFVPQQLECMAARRAIAATVDHANQPSALWLQRLGLTRWFHMLTGYRHMQLPAGPPDAVERHKQLALTDTMATGVATALANAVPLARQLKPTNSPLRAAYITSAAPSNPLPPCYGENGIKATERYFSDVLVLRTSHEVTDDLHTRVDLIMQAINHIVQ